jgi:hypothetical protein
MSYADDPLVRRERLETKLAPERIRSTLAFAAVYQMAHEMIKYAVVEKVKGFYGHSSLESGMWLWGQQGKDRYNREVLTLAPKNLFRASLGWLQSGGAISEAQVARLDEIYGHRHELTHELAKFIVDVDSEPDVGLLTDAVQIMRDISRFWAQIEKDIGTFDDHGDVDVAAVQPGSLLVLEICIQAYVEGLEMLPAGGNE